LAVDPKAVQVTKKTKPAPNKARPPRPTKKWDAADIDRADSEGMAQPQGTAALRKSPPKKRAAQAGGKKKGRHQ